MTSQVFLPVLLQNLLLDVLGVVAFTEARVFVAQFIQNGRGERRVIQRWDPGLLIDFESKCIIFAVLVVRVLFDGPGNFDIKTGDVSSVTRKFAVAGAL